jgi:hypothetical protein
MKYGSQATSDAYEKMQRISAIVSHGTCHGELRLFDEVEPAVDDKTSFAAEDAAQEAVSKVLESTQAYSSSKVTPRF